MPRRVLLVVVAVSMLVGCQPASAVVPAATLASSNPPATSELVATPEATVPSQVTLTDALGRTVILDERPQRVVVAGRAGQLILHAAFFFEEADPRVVAMEQRTQRKVSMLPLVDASYAEVLQLERDASAEAIAAANPDVVLLKSYLADTLGAPLEALGLTTLYLDLETPEQFFRDVRTLGELFGNPARAEQVLAFYQQRLDRVAEAAASIPSEQRPRVLLVQYSDQGGTVAVNVPPAAWLQTRLVELAGGVPVWLEASGSGWTVVDFEQIAAWDPDWIFIVYYPGDPSPAMASLKADANWQALKAVRQGRLLGFPGDFLSWDQPDPRWILGLEWLARQLLPEEAFPVDLRAELLAFYEELYGLAPSVVEAEVIPLLNGDHGF